MKQNILYTAKSTSRKIFYYFLFVLALQIFAQINVNAATYTVINTNDSGTGSLRQAILDANATTADDTINFNIAGCPNSICTITLTNGELVVNAASTAGKLTITNSTGADNLRISGNNASRIFNVSQNANVIFDSVTVLNGKASEGGGISNTDGTLTINNSIVSNNVAQQRGGGVYTIFGNLTINNSAISNNSVVDNSLYAQDGGGIASQQGNLTVTNSILSNNLAMGFGGGISCIFGSATITDSTISDNSAAIDEGGGIYTSYGNNLTINNSIVSRNASGPQYFGSGITNGGTATIINSTISNNAPLGGFENYGNLMMTNSTVSGNTGGGIINFSSGNQAVTLTNVTVTNNRSFCTTCAGGIYSNDNTNINLLNTIIAGNTMYDNGTSSPDLQGAVSSTSSFNLIGNGGGMTGITNGTNNNQVGTSANPTDSRLAPLGNYGGTTQTHALLSNSTAIDAGSDCVIDSTCSSNNPPVALTTDQRGASFPRKIGSAVDIGAVEFVTSNVVNNNGQILFVSNRDGNDEIYKMNANGSGQTRLTNNTVSESEPQASSDGTKIVFASSRDGNSEIYVMNSDGTNQTRITNNTFFDTEPSWSPDGTKIVFQSNRNNNRDIYAINADGSNETRLTTAVGFDILPKWSPDGSKIAFVSSRDGGNGFFEIYVMAADGSNQIRLTNTSGTSFSPDWSPNSSRLLFSSYGSGNSDIFIMNADGTNPAQLTSNSSEEESPSWSPDGLKIAFSTNRDGNSEIYTMNANGTNQQRLTNIAGTDYEPDWQAIPSYTVSTPAGQNISVTPTSNLNLNFGTVMTAGNTVATVLSPNQLQPLPSGFTLFGSNLIYDITTSAVFSGNITVTFAVPNVADAATCGNLRSLHYENGAWTTDTNATPIYNAGTQICTVAQTVTSLSPFVVVLQTPASFSYEADVQSRPSGDGFIDADDIQQIRLFSVSNGLPYQSNEFQRADCSPRSTLGDGFVDSDDVQQARRYSVGTDSNQIAGGPSSGSAPFQLDSTTAAINEAFDSSTLFTNGKSKKQPAFHISSQTVSPNQTITVPVLIDATGREAGYTFSLSYDAAVLTDPQVTIGNAGGDVVFNATTAGHIGFSVTSFSGETIASGANQVLVNVTFTVAADAAAGTTSVNFTDALARRKASGIDPNISIVQPSYTGGIITIGSSKTVKNFFNVTNN